MTEPENDAESAEVAEVRRLLAQARHDDPIPDDVSARMDTVLAGLATPGASPGTPDNVVTIAAHRRRRVGALLVAAAAVVVGAVTLGPHLPSGSHGSSAGSAADSSTGQSLAGGGAATPSAPSSNLAPESGKTSPAPRARVRGGRLVVSDGHFSTDARQGRRLLAGSTTSSLQSLSDCAGLPSTPQAVAATYRRAPAALVFRAPQGSSQVVDLYVCGSREPVRSTTLTAP